MLDTPIAEILPATLLRSHVRRLRECALDFADHGSNEGIARDTRVALR